VKGTIGPYLHAASLVAGFDVAIQTEPSSIIGIRHRNSLRESQNSLLKEQTRQTIAEKAEEDRKL